MKIKLFIQTIAALTFISTFASATCTNLDCPTVTAPPRNPTCVVPGYTRLQTSTLSYGAYPTPTRNHVNVTEWENLWGYFNPTDAQAPWPGYNGSGPVLRQFTKSSFISAHFRTGPATTPHGFFTYPYQSALPMDVVISRVCGDFTPNPGCSVSGAQIPGNTLVSWTFATNNRTKCILRPNEDYYINMRYSNPAASSAGCPAGNPNCPLPTLIQIAY